MTDNTLAYNPFIMGDRILLREVGPSDINEVYYHWMNDFEITQYLESRFFPNSDESLRNFVNEQSLRRDTAFLAIILKNNQRHIGNVKLGPINWIHRFASIGIVIGDKSSWRKGYATETIQLITQYAFNKLNLHKVTAGAYASNPGAIKAFEKAGFEREGILKKHYFFKGKHVDAILLGKTNEESQCSVE